MSKIDPSTPNADALSAKPLRSYAAPWKGHLVLACRKCQKKLKSGHETANVRKTLKCHAKQHPNGLRLRVLQVSCLKLCPRGAVTVCTQHQLACAEYYIVRTCADLEALYAQCCKEAGSQT